MKIHFIAIGGSVMHNLAIALHKLGHDITGSDDEIFEPAKSQLSKHDILPVEMGWTASNISNDTDLVILGMHAKIDNIELIAAQEQGKTIMSFPEYIYEHSKDKLRVVIGGSHGKTSITSMIMHVLNFHTINFDYMVGARIEGFDTMVKLSNDAKVIILEGDEYPASALNKVPKFHLYHPNIAVLSGIAWDHVNVFPTFENYCEQFSIFLDMINDDGTLFHYKRDDVLNNLVKGKQSKCDAIAYTEHPYTQTGNDIFLKIDTEIVPVQIFGKHNLQNLQAAKLVCNKVGVDDNQFYEAIQTFTGAAKRLELLKENGSTVIYKDFAHSPSKVKATVEAVKSKYPNKKLIACLELHTYSSLTQEFIEYYKNTLSDADEAMVYYDQHALDLKKLPPLIQVKVQKAFNKENMEVISDADVLKQKLFALHWKDTVLLLMSSGNFGGLNMDNLVKFAFDK